jgi:precorrin-6Y C5,15-methyltransferase (decarboxylating)
LLRKVRQIEIRTRRLVAESLAGQYHSAFKGQGMDFDEVREYQPGDEVRTIDWNVTARMNHPFVKKFREERELTVMLVVDLSGSGRFGSGQQSKRALMAELAAVLTETGRGASEFIVLEQLGGPGERIRSGPAEAWATAPPSDIDALNVIAIEYLPDERIGGMLPDDALHHDGQITKPTVRAVTLAALAPRPGELLWDVGSGSGSIAVEWCRSGSGCRAVAFETRPDRRMRIVANARAFGADIDVREEAPEGFEGAAQPNVIFIGGGLTGPGMLEACLAQLPAGGRLVANAVTAESEAFLVQWHSRLGGELRRFQHYQGEPLGGFTGWRPQMPITQWLLTVVAVTQH